MRRIGIVAAVIALFTAGFVVGWWVGDEIFGPGPVLLEEGRQVREPGYRFISPLLECETGPRTTGQHALQSIGVVVDRLVRSRVNGTSISHISAYFRDLNNGPWFGINEGEHYSPASMLKVPLMIVALKQAERDPRFLGERVLYPHRAADANQQETFRSAEQMVPGKTYTVEDLVSRMVQHSDNNAMELLLGKLDRGLERDVYADLSLPMPETTGRLENFMSVKEYASTFRILFNASYLSRENSEKALRILSGSTFTQGLVAGVPPGTIVAHKFGERYLGKNGEIKQLHDCGIVYHPARPYLLCIMTRGSSFEGLDDVIRDISSTVYKEVADRMTPR